MQPGANRGSEFISDIHCGPKYMQKSRDRPCRDRGYKKCPQFRLLGNVCIYIYIILYVYLSGNTFTPCLRFVYLFVVCFNIFFVVWLANVFPCDCRCVHVTCFERFVIRFGPGMQPTVEQTSRTLFVVCEQRFPNVFHCWRFVKNEKRCDLFLSS